MNSLKSGWINNMNAKDTFDQIYHLRRTMSYAGRIGDRGLQKVCARMLQGYIINQPAIAYAALSAHVAKTVTQ